MNKDKVFKKYKDKAARLITDRNRLSGLMDKTSEKLKNIIENNEKLKKLSDMVFIFLRMLKHQFTGEYNNMPWKTLLLVVGALLYFVTPFDMIPDFIPALGFTDDLSIIYWVFNSVKEDIDQFKNWENTLEIEVPHES